MESEIYLGYRLLVILIIAFYFGHLSLRCNKSLSRWIVLGMGMLLILENEFIAVILSSILAVMITLAICVFFFVLVFVLITGHSLGGIFQHFNIFRRR